MDNIFWKGRGVAGTHEIQFGYETITKMKKCTDNSKLVSIPFYDKSLRGGNGDRGNPSDFK